MPYRPGPEVRAADPLYATVVSGRREAAGFVAVPWVREQLRGLLGGTPFAGTLNLQVSDRSSLDAWRRRSAEGAPRTLEPGEPGYCESGYFPALLNASVPCAVVVPHVSGYPPDVLEVVAVDNLRDRLGLGDGATVTVSFEAAPPGPAGPSSAAVPAPERRPGGAAEAKDRHIEVCITEDVESIRTTGLEAYELLGALPDFALADIDTSVQLFGRRLAMPLLISSMTGGGRRSGGINRLLAEAAQRFGLGMAVGSQKLMIVDPGAADSFRVRRFAPDILLFADLGLVHLTHGFGRAECLRAVEEIEADALVFYVNPLHEALQPAGDLDFSGALDRLADVIADFPYPVLVKEVGWGLPETLLATLAGPPFAGLLGGVETAGLGGTHWGRVEALAAGRAVGRPEEELGTRTADSLAAAVRLLPAGTAVIASGGIRDGVQAAKALALGATAVGMALPFLRWADESAQRLDDGIRGFERELRLAMWHTGSARVGDLRGRVRPPPCDR